MEQAHRQDVISQQGLWGARELSLLLKRIITPRRAQIVQFSTPLDEWAPFLGVSQGWPRPARGHHRDIHPQEKGGERAACSARPEMHATSNAAYELHLRYKEESAT
ncbi:hypothetical protein AAFF_G00098940 [Aldrovandia affinis]|uniref:Uncharacterized protein n=1 Tax=Aldrovandia affinis TaxID=143900 RepID=A0AAD7WCK4_9TELE|nr:hypothetical protein AAFF_G00098940 [Aldrovandia affinis]